jgi:hypothetical protein
MVYLYASSSNTVSLIPSQSFSSGEEVRLLFTDRFTEATSSVSLNVTASGQWVKAAVNLPSDSGVVPVEQIWGTSTQIWSTSEVVWEVGTVEEGDQFINDTTTTAFVSESIGRTLYSSANENGVFVVYEG